MNKVCSNCIHNEYCEQKFPNLVKKAPSHTRVIREKYGFITVPSDCPLYPKHKKPERERVIFT